MTAGNRIRVIIVDDHPVVRNGIKFSLQVIDDIELVGEAASGQEALRLCREVRPDVVLMDLKMPDDGVAATRAIRQRHPGVRVLALTSFWEGELVQRALGAGAIGYLLKDMALDELAAAIRLAHAGQSTLAPAAAQALVEFTASVVQSLDLGNDLSQRERQVLTLLVEGRGNVEIAAHLGISLSTARFHVSNVLSKLQAANRAEAAALAVKHGLI